MFSASGASESPHVQYSMGLYYCKTLPLCYAGTLLGKGCFMLVRRDKLEAAILGACSGACSFIP